MKVKKRDGRTEDVSFDKVIRRIQFLCDGIEPDGHVIGQKLSIDPTVIAQKVIHEIKDGITTTELDEFAANCAATMVIQHPDYDALAGRIIISNHHKNTVKSFSDTIKLLYENQDTLGKPAPLIDYSTYKIIMKNRDRIDQEIDYNRDYVLNYFGFKTLDRSYLIKLKTTSLRVQERPQHLYMRVAIGIHGKDLERAFETYHYMSRGFFTHATPTLFNAGTPHAQLSSCFLLGMDDSIAGIYDCLKHCAEISKWAGGIGVHISNIRAKDALIRGTNGKSTGIVPMLRVYNETANYVNQGGKRLGSIAIYLEPWHADIKDFLNLKKTHGDQSKRALDLFYALYIPDIFMRRLKESIETKKPVMWSVMCPDECPGLYDTYGEVFEELYDRYERDGQYREQIPILDIWESVLTAQKETGMPYILYKDSINHKSNQKNIGVIRSSNLCTEIMEYSDDKESAVCNLGSVALSMFIKTDSEGKPYFDHEDLRKVTGVLTRNLNKVIDINYYPTENTRRSNLRHRPIGIGVQGLADAFLMMKYPFDSPEARRLNQEIFETMYYGALQMSVELAIEEGPYETFKGSPFSKGILQFDMWDHKPESGRWDWTALKEQVVKHGTRNSLLLAPMPTATTAQILGNTTCFEPVNYNLFTRRVLSGEFTVVNRYLQKDMIERGLWNDDFIDEFKAHRGSVQAIESVPQDIKDLYKTVWEIKQKVIIDLAADRGPFIDQSQSMNLFIQEPDNHILTSMHLYSWKRGLKTGLYYLRREPVTKAIQFTVDPTKRTTSQLKSNGNQKTSANKPVSSKESADSEPFVCSRDNPDCEACQ